MRIAIVNDVGLEIEILKKSLKSLNNYEIAWTASNGLEAVEKCTGDKPDLILMNLVMPKMDGAQATKVIMENDPVAILIVTSSVAGNQAKVFDAMGYGALDVVSTPVLGSDGSLVGTDELIKKIETVKKLVNYHKQYRKESMSGTQIRKRTKLVAIGSSTGGPKALSVILSELRAPLNAAVVIVQHVDSQFASGLADWLRNYSKPPILLIKNGVAPENGNIYIATTNDHLILNPKGEFSYSSEPSDIHFRPSVDVFFNSLKENWIYKDLAVLLTGMGYDGAKGLLELKLAGWHTIAQDESTSIVYGMPKAAAELGAAKEILPIGEIAASIRKFIN